MTGVEGSEPVTPAAVSMQRDLGLQRASRPEQKNVDLNVDVNVNANALL